MGQNQNVIFILTLCTSHMYGSQYSIQLQLSPGFFQEEICKYRENMNASEIWSSSTKQLLHIHIVF